MSEAGAQREALKEDYRKSVKTLTEEEIRQGLGCGNLLDGIYIEALLEELKIRETRK